MHTIEPFANWLRYYDPSHDDQSPYFGKEYNFDVYKENIYGYYIDPAWDSFGSETLYAKVLYVDYDRGYAVIEFIGEWNDTINNDIMALKRGLIEPIIAQSVDKFILVGENIMNFHGSDDSYYEEWYGDVEAGWIAAVNMPRFVQDEMKRYRIDQYMAMGDALQIDNWRTFHPERFCEIVDGLIQRRLN